MHTVIISIGANIGDRKKNIRLAISQINFYAEITKCSRPCRTRPYGKTDQPCFINMAVRAETSLTPAGLLKKLHATEDRLGRVRTVRWGERTIDLDIIFYDSLVIKSRNLIIPHPDMHNRYFVLKPLTDICPEFVHPVMKKTVKELYDELADKY